MQAIDQLLHVQSHRLRRARIYGKAADRAHAIALEHERERTLLMATPPRDGSGARAQAEFYHHGLKSSRAFALARRLYGTARDVLLGAA